MKKIIGIFLVSLFALLFFNFSYAYVSVRGYYRSDGTYVRPHVRSNPNGLKYDNYSWTPSQGLYNKTYGTRGSYWDTPTWDTDPNYYEGRNIYNINNRPSGMSRREYRIQYGGTVSSYKPYGIEKRPSGMSRREYKAIYGE